MNNALSLLDLLPIPIYLYHDFNHQGRSWERRGLFKQVRAGLEMPISGRAKMELYEVSPRLVNMVKTNYNRQVGTYRHNFPIFYQTFSLTGKQSRWAGDTTHGEADRHDVCQLKADAPGRGNA